MGGNETKPTNQTGNGPPLPFPFQQLGEVADRARSVMPQETQHLDKAFKMLASLLASFEGFSTDRYDEGALTMMTGEVYDASLAACMLLSACQPQQAAAVLRSAYESFCDMEIVLQDSSQGENWINGSKLKLPKDKPEGYKWAHKVWKFLSRASHGDFNWRGVYVNQPSAHKMALTFGAKDPETNQYCLYAMRSISWRIAPVVLRTTRKVSDRFKDRLDLEESFWEDLNTTEQELSEGISEWTKKQNQP